jgi:iron complex outermembrane receptor protein
MGLARAEVAADPRQATPTALSFDTRKSLRQLQSGLVLEHAFSPQDAVRLTGYLGERAITQFQAIPVASQAPATSPGGVIVLGRDYQGGDARYIHRGYLNDGAYTLTAGLSLDNLDERRLGYNDFIGTQTGVQGNLRLDAANRALAFDQYAQGEWQAWPGWRLSAGVRHTRVGITSQDHYIMPGNGDDSGAVVYSATNPALGVVRQLTDSLNAYVTAGRGFETPTLDQLAYSPSGSGLNLGLKPAVSRQAEAGLKANYGAVLVNAAVFAARTANEIVVISNTGGRSVYQNAGHTARSGFELAASGKAGDHLALTLAYTYVNARYVDSFLSCPVTPCAAAAAVLVPGQSRLPGVPQNSLYGEALWRLRPRSGEGPLAALEMRLLGSVPVNDRNTDAAAGYTIFNARVGHDQRVGSWTLSEFLRVDNLANRNYIGAVVVNDSNGRYFEPSPGRTYTVGASAVYRFR